VIKPPLEHPDLYVSHSRESARELFGGQGEGFCGETFVVFPESVLCFFELSGVPGGAVFSSPEEIAWYPVDQNADPYTNAWFPQEARGKWNPGSTQIHHLFVRNKRDAPYVYLGPADLGSLGGQAGSLSARFYLRNRVPHARWLDWTGFDSWMVHVNHRPYQLKKGDLPRLKKLVESGLKRRAVHIELTRYEGDSLTVFFNRNRAWPMYLRNASDSGQYAPASSTENTEIERFPCSCGADLEIPHNRTLDRQAGANLIYHLVSEGTLSPLLEWTDEVP